MGRKAENEAVQRIGFHPMYSPGQSYAGKAAEEVELAERGGPSGSAGRSGSGTPRNQLALVHLKEGKCWGLG